MTYNSKDKSLRSGMPFFLYRFLRGGEAYRFTSQPEDHTNWGGIGGTYTASSITHSKIGLGQPSSKDELEITFPLSNEFAFLFLKKHTQFLPTTVTIWRGHEDDTDEDPRVVFKGRVRAGRPTEGGQIVLKCSSIYSSVRVIGNSASVQRPCRHSLYNRGCNLHRADFEVDGDIEDITDDIIKVTQATDKPNGYYDGGIMEFEGSLVMILQHEGKNLKVRAVMDNIVAAYMDGPVTVTIAPGCNRTVNHCKNRFDNILNFGGFRYLPLDDPWNNGSIA